MPEDTIYMVRVDDAVIGPVTFDQITRGSAAGKIPKEAEVQAVGTSQWLPLWAILKVPKETRERLSEPPPPAHPAVPADPSWSGFAGGRPAAPAYGVRLPPPKAPQRKAALRRGSPRGAAGPLHEDEGPDWDDTDATIMTTPASEELLATALRQAPAAKPRALQLPPPSSPTRAATPRALGAPPATSFFMVFNPETGEPPSGPFSLADIHSKYARGLIADGAIVCEVDQHARWITLLELIAR